MFNHRLKCPYCLDYVYEDEDCVEINGKIFHTVCVGELNVFEALEMFGVEVKEVN